MSSRRSMLRSLGLLKMPIEIEMFETDGFGRLPQQIRPAANLVGTMIDDNPLLNGRL